MAKFTDWGVCPEATDIMERIVEKYPQVFETIDVSRVGAVLTRGKSSRFPLKLKPVKYPFNVWIDGVDYILEVFDVQWSEMDDKQKALAVFHIMCMFPQGAFDENSSDFAKKKRADYELFAEEFAVSGGVPNWMENPSAEDPLEEDSEEESDDVKRVPVTAEDITSVMN